MSAPNSITITNLQQIVGSFDNYGNLIQAYGPNGVPLLLPSSGNLGNSTGVNPPAGIVGEFQTVSTAGTTATVTISIASPGVISWAAHGLLPYAAVTFTTTGALPTGLVSGTTYYVLSVLSTGTFTVSATPGGSAVVTSGTQSGVQTGTSSVNLSTGVAKNIAAMFLTAGTYDMSGVVVYHSASGTTIPSDVKQGFSLVSATFDVLGTWSYDYIGLAITDDPSYTTPTDRVLIPVGGAIVYLVGLSDFTVSTLTAYGQLRATRVY